MQTTALVLANSVEGARRNIIQVREISRTFGLELNEEKSAIIVSKGNIGVREMEGIKVVKEVKYLGLKITGDRKMFEKQKQELIKKAEGRATEISSIIETSCNKLLVGKTWWKNVIVPGVLTGVGVLSFTVEQVDRLQVIENRVYRRLMGVTRATAISALRGEVGASLMRSRIIESKVKLAKSMMTSDNELVREVANRVLRDGDSNWNKLLKRYMVEVGIGRGDLETMDKEGIRAKVREYDNKEWREELNARSTLWVYRV